MTFSNRIADAAKLQQEINIHRPLKGQALKQLLEYFRIGLTWASNALEGNSLTETETKVVIEDGITIAQAAQGPLRGHRPCRGLRLPAEARPPQGDHRAGHPEAAQAILLPHRRGQRRPLPEAEHHRHRHRLRFPRTERAKGVDDHLCR